VNVILDYGMGNLRSVEKACQFLGFDCSVQNTLAGATKLILPGVGAFGAAMERLAPFRDEIRAFAESGRPLLGICLGQQLLFESSEEMGSHEGLGLIAGRVRYFPADMGLKIPHVGWNELTFKAAEGLGEGAKAGDQVYFVHSLYTECENEADVAAECTYGIRFAAAVESANVWGTQFHPEKSGAVGLRMLGNFLRC
jgi:imidazole glycerol-phosphate synthase subunit HisH